MILGDVLLEYPCPQCGKTYKVSGSLRRHIKYECGRRPREEITGYTATEGIYECNTCGRRYKVFGSLKRHLKYECEKLPNIPCPVKGCEYKAKINCRMIQHVRMVHKLQC